MKWSQAQAYTKIAELIRRIVLGPETSPEELASIQRQAQKIPYSTRDRVRLEAAQQVVAGIRTRAAAVEIIKPLFNTESIDVMPSIISLVRQVGESPESTLELYVAAATKGIQTRSFWEVNNLLTRELVREFSGEANKEKRDMLIATLSEATERTRTFGPGAVRRVNTDPSSRKDQQKTLIQQEQMLIHEFESIRPDLERFKQDLGRITFLEGALRKRGCLMGKVVTEITRIQTEAQSTDDPDRISNLLVEIRAIRKIRATLLRKHTKAHERLRRYEVYVGHFLGRLGILYDLKRMNNEIVELSSKKPAEFTMEMLDRSFPRTTQRDVILTNLARNLRDRAEWLEARYPQRAEAHYKRAQKRENQAIQDWTVDHHRKEARRER